jgi:hypothetical protein
MAAETALRKHAAERVAIKGRNIARSQTLILARLGFRM